ncbi:MAG: ferritin [Holosporaceae bacterium]|jgi:ferritin|nr:ferritin [Holosporaceae bacterium]
MNVSLGKRVYEALNKQISEELSSAYLYMAMSSVFKEMGLNGCASWIMSRAGEKRQNAIKIFEHMHERGAKVKLLPIAAPKQDWRAPLHIFEELLRYEQRTTGVINSIYEFTVVEKDYQSQCFVSWFVNEQVGKEATASNLLNRLRKMQSTDLGVLIFDSELEKMV